MWIIDLYDQVELPGYIAMWALVLSLFTTSLLIIILSITHIFLSRRLDPILFNERWFSSAELVMFNVWPTLMYKVITYMGLIGFPELVLKTRRFRGYDLDLTFSRLMVVFSRCCIFMILFIGFCLLVFFIVGIYSYFQ